MFGYDKYHRFFTSVDNIRDKLPLDAAMGIINVETFQQISKDKLLKIDAQLFKTNFSGIRSPDCTHQNCSHHKVKYECTIRGNSTPSMQYFAKSI